MAKAKATVEEWTTACEAYMAEMHATLFGRVRYIATADERAEAAREVAEMILAIADHLPSGKKKG